MKALYSRFLADESGVTSIEYALIGGLISIAIVIGAGLLGVKVGDLYQAMADAIPAAS